jgi:outer membrane protein
LKNHVKLLFAAITLVAPVLALAQETGADGWDVSVGAGVVAGPRALGASGRRTMAVPVVRATYQDWFFANPIDGVGVKTKAQGVTLSAALGVDFNERKHDDGARYANLREIKLAPAGRFGAKYDAGPFSSEATLSVRAGGSGKNGATLTLEEGYEVYASARTLVTAGVSARLMDSSFSRNFFSVSAADAATSGLRSYQARSGLYETGLFVQAVYPVAERWTIFSKVQYNSLRGDAKNSPLVERRNAPSLLLFATYSL